MRDISISTIQRITEHIIVNNTDEHFSNKMFKSNVLYYYIIDLGVKVIEIFLTIKYWIKDRMVRKR